MKTAMQELLGLVEQMFANANTKEVESAMNDVINIITQQGLEKEKEQMCKFQEDGQSTDFWVKYDSWEDCFDKTFNTEEK